MKRILILLCTATALVAVSACSSGKAQQSAGVRTDALDDSAWECSEWISAADAPVVTGKVHSADNNLAANGASWFVSEPINGKQVQSAKWMTAGLGVYQLFVNGKPVGEEYLKPGFTHYATTKYSPEPSIARRGHPTNLPCSPPPAGGETRSSLPAGTKA